MPDRESEVAAAPAGAAEESTVGTGSVFAIGCTVATLLVILIGVAIVFLR